MSDKTQVIKFKIERADGNPSSQAVNFFFILCYCILAVAAVYFFIANPSIKSILISLGLFFLLTVLLELANGYLNTEYIVFGIVDGQFIITKGPKVEKFNIKRCKIKYHTDKTDWLEVNCEDQKFTFSLSHRPTKDLLNFINFLDETQ